MLIEFVPQNGLFVPIYSMSISSASLGDRQERLYVWFFGQPERNQGIDMMAECGARRVCRYYGYNRN
jgi:hypothetical protein